MNFPEAFDMDPAAEREQHSGESGYVLIGVLFLVVIILIGLAISAPKIATQIRRDKELELYHRGMQYTRAIKLYYKKFGSYPISMDQLEKSNNLRFLRRRYTDPFTGKADWRLIHVGEARVAQTGLFGQPLGATGAAGTTGLPGSPGSGIAGQPSGQSPNLNNSLSGSPSNSNSGGISSLGGLPGGGSTVGGSPVGVSTSPTDPNNPGLGGTNSGGTTGLGGSTLTSSNGSPIGSTGPIIGVSSSLKKESIREFKKQKHYNEWEFVYNPQADLGGLGGNNGMGVAGQGGTNTSGFGNSFGTGAGGSGSGMGFGGSGGSFGSGTGNGSGFGSGSGNGSGSTSNGNPGSGTSGNGNQPTDPNNPNPGNPNQPNPNQPNPDPNQPNPNQPPNNSTPQ